GGAKGFIASVTNVTLSARCCTVSGLGRLARPFLMRRIGLVLVCTLALASLAAAGARAHSTPQIRAQQAHARSVLAEVSQIGRNLQVVEDQAWNAKQRLQLVKQSLRRNEYRLHVARGNFRGAQKRLMARLYSLYVN